MGNFHNSRARRRRLTMLGELGMNPSNYVRSLAQAQQYIPLASGHPCQAGQKHEQKPRVTPSKSPARAYFSPALGRRTQFDITIIIFIDPANIFLYLPILTRTAFVDYWNNSRIDRQADAQNVRCRGVADGDRMVAAPALFITEWFDAQKCCVFFLLKIPKNLLVGMFATSNGRKPRRN